MAQLPKNEKTFSVTNRNSSTFTLLIANFQFAATLLFRIISRIRITFVSKATIKFLLTLTIKRIKLVVSQVKLIVSQTQTINVKPVRLSVVFRQTVKALATITLKNPIGFRSSAIQKVVSNINLRKVILTITPTLAHFFTLGNYDPDTLLTMDSQTLGQLDYV